jgi:hypothetical protein
MSRVKEVAPLPSNVNYYNTHLVTVHDDYMLPFLLRFPNLLYSAVQYRYEPIYLSATKISPQAYCTS